MSSFVLILSVFLSNAYCYDYRFSKSSIITGGTGVLGSCLTKKFSEIGYHTYCSYRSIERLNKNNFLSVNPFHLDSKLPISMLPSIVEGSHAVEHVLVNNAACCLSGSSPNILKESINMNTLIPIKLIEQYVSFAENHLNKSVTVINISSGDGELCYLNSRIAGKLTNIFSIPQLMQFIIELKTTFEEDIEFAFGETPMYSLSKALLNRATYLFHHELCDKLPNFRILSCCPGNFASPMSTFDELTDAIPVERAADHVIELATNKREFPGGFFYRHGKKIDW